MTKFKAGQIVARQGDVNLIKVDRLPKNVVKKDNVIALGEHTGHKHVLKGQAQVLVDKDGNQYIENGDGSVLVHDVHGQVQLPAEKYLKVTISRERTLLGQTRQVMD